MKNNNNYFRIIFFTIIIFSLLLFLNTEKEIINIKIIDKNNNLINEQSIGLPLSAQTQSLFTNKLPDLLSTINTQSTIPISNKDQAKTIFKAVVKNPFDDNAYLDHLLITKNNDSYGGKTFVKLYLEQDQTYIYKSDELELTGLDGQKNIFVFDFIFINSNGDKKSQKYQFEYFSVTECVSNNDCDFPNILCDIGNTAKFSTQQGVYYCTKPCASNTDCYKGQICHKGFCGY